MVDSVFIVESQSLLPICILRSLIFISCGVNLVSLYGRACECDWKELVSMQDYGQLLIVHCQRITQALESYVCIHPRHVAQNHRIIESSLTFISLSFCRAIKTLPHIQTFKIPYVLLFCPFRERFINQCFQSQYKCKNLSLPRSTNRSGT
jgi:hypothetical protein